jgi:X-Pro dipeptidyl-peptidase
MEEPMVDIQREDKTWHTEGIWPAAETADTKLYFSPATNSFGGSLSLLPVPNKNKQNQHFIDDASITAETLAKNPGSASQNRFVYVTPPLE